MPALVVLGARNLGGAILDHFRQRGWAGAAVARSEDTLAAVRERGALALGADASDPGELGDALARARDELGGLDLVVNAVSASTASGPPFGGGPIADASLEAFRGWAVSVAEQCFVFLSCGVRACVMPAAAGRSCRSPAARRGARSLGAGHGPRGIREPGADQAAAQELREEGIHVALLAVDATIESPKTAAFTRDTPRDALASMEAVAARSAF
jgi:hypothetical protein